MAITHAKIGRSIKNFAMKQAPCYCAPEAAADDAAAALAGAPDAPALDAAAAEAGAAAAGAAAPDASFGADASCAGTAFTVAPGRTLSTP
ncbi:hypothetical protein V6G61_005846, partial [Burkholderia multivorans]